MRFNRYYLFATLGLFVACSTSESDQIGTPSESTTPATETVSADDEVDAAEFQLPDQLTQVAPELPPVPSLKIGGPEYAELYDKLQKEPEVFEINPQRDTVLFCAEGTKISVPARTFANPQNGMAVSSLVSLSVTEYYQYSDMLLGGLSTLADKGLLESGGMIFVNAISEGSEVAVGAGRSMEIGFPKRSDHDDMQLFMGDVDGAREITWQLASERSGFVPPVPEVEEMPIEEVMTFASVEPEFPGGEEELWKYLADEVRYPSLAREAGIQGKVFVRFKISTAGDVENIEILRGIGGGCDREVERVIKDMPKWTPAKQNGKRVDAYYTLPVRFMVSGSGGGTTINRNNTNNVTFKEDFENFYADGNMENVTARDVEYYLLSTSELGWINCDRWYQVENKTDLMVDVPTDGTTNIKMVFHNFRAIQVGSLNHGKAIFNQVPVGEPVTLFAVRYEDGQAMLAMTETTINRRNKFTLDFKKVTIEELKAGAAQLDAIKVNQEELTASL